MREIKFRAWDKEKQFMYTPTQIELTQGENFAKWDKWRPMAWRDELPEEGSGGIGRALGDECELMQYTGLKDKYGKEIYEGDILEFSGNVVALGIVKYNENFATFQACNGNSGWLFGNESGTNIEILGNIYENTELVKN